MANAQKKVEEEKPYVSYDSCEIYEDQVGYLLERAKEDGEELTEDEARKQAYEDYELLNWAFEDVCECLTELMKELDKGNDAWYATMSGFGWRGASGSKTFTADNGKDFLCNILPKTDCTFYIFKRKDCIAIQNFHHDSCTGKEWYYIYAAKTCACCGEILDEDNTWKTTDDDYVCEDCAVNSYEEDEVKKEKV